MPVNMVATDQARHLRPPLNHKPDAWHEDKPDLVRALENLAIDVLGPENGPKRAGIRSRL